MYPFIENFKFYLDPLTLSEAKPFLLKRAVFRLNASRDTKENESENIEYKAQQKLKYLTTCTFIKSRTASINEISNVYFSSYGDMDVQIERPNQSLIF